MLSVVVVGRGCTSRRAPHSYAAPEPAAPAAIVTHASREIDDPGFSWLAVLMDSGPDPTVVETPRLPLKVLLPLVAVRVTVPD